jgi:hypothetical protein
VNEEMEGIAAACETAVQYLIISISRALQVQAL